MSRVALVQLDVSDREDVEQRVARALTMVERAATEVDVVVLPELWHVGAFDMDAARAHAEPMDGPLVTGLRDVARRTSTWVHGGSFAEIDDAGARHNTAVLIGPAGDVVARYRKIHLFGFDEGEPTVMTAGSDLVLAATPLGVTGLATCYDLRFPELYRALTVAGAETFLMCSGWPDRRIEHWTVLARARAIEDQAWVVACNAAGEHAGVRMGGRSLVVDPMGAVVAQAGADEEVLVAEVDVDVVSPLARPVPGARRPDDVAAGRTDPAEPKEDDPCVTAPARSAAGRRSTRSRKG